MNAYYNAIIIIYNPIQWPTLSTLFRRLPRIYIHNHIHFIRQRRWRQDRRPRATATPMTKMTSEWHPSAPSFAHWVHALILPVKNGILERATVQKKQGEIIISIINNDIGNMTKHEELALISGIVTITAFSLLIQHVYVTKITENLTYFWIFLNLTGQSLLFTYGKINNIFGIYFPALILIGGISYVLYVKMAYPAPNKWI